MTKRRTLLTATLLATLAGTSVASAAGVATAQAPAAKPVLGKAGKIHGLEQLSTGKTLILRATPGQLDALSADVKAAGGNVKRSLTIIDSIVVSLPNKSAAQVATSPNLLSVSVDGKVSPMQATGIDEMIGVQGDSGSLNRMTTLIKANTLWSQGVTGNGIDIAVIDTGVSPVKGLAGPKVLNGPDISLDSPFTALKGYDAYGHGTHMASIAAGLDADTTNLNDPSKFVGVAPGARIVNVKVGAFDGGTDVSQVIAGIDWVVQHKNDPGMNIRVLNLSYGVDSTNNFYDDPLSWAAEVAWRSGIVVVAASGNEGGRANVTSPAYNPRLIAVGAIDQSQMPLSAAAFTSASGLRQPDMWAPGGHVLGLTVPGSYVDARNPSAKVGTRMIRGTGTSQAAAVTSGAAALLLSQYPNRTPDQVKLALAFSGKDVNGAWADMIQVDKAATKLGSFGNATNSFGIVLGKPGTGAIERSRGNTHLTLKGVTLMGEKDIMGNPWNSKIMAAAARSGTAWTGGTFNGAGWSGAGWSGAGWSGAGWSGAGWSGAGWSGAGWSGAGWSGAGWSSTTWLGAGWSGAGWSGAGWSGAGWSGAGWSGAGWSGAGWSGAGWSGAGWSGAGWSGAGWSGAGWSGKGWMGAVWG